MRRLRLAAPLTVAAVLLASPAVALGHGEEGEAAAEIPARSHVQQALALLTQANDPTEAMEKLEAALTSTDKKGVEIAAVQEALAALEQGDHELAVEHLNAALGAGEAPEAPAEEPPAGDEAEHEEGAAPAGEPEPAGAAFEHADELEPDPGTAEWIALIVGIALGGAALALLASGRRAA